jgi:hypothetical protein
VHVEEIERGGVEPRIVHAAGMEDRIRSVGDVWADLSAEAHPLGPAAARLAD